MRVGWYIAAQGQVALGGLELLPHPGEGLFFVPPLQRLLRVSSVGRLRAQKALAMALHCLLLPESKAIGRGH